MEGLRGVAEALAQRAEVAAHQAGTRGRRWPRQQPPRGDPQRLQCQPFARDHRVKTTERRGGVAHWARGAGSRDRSSRTLWRLQRRRRRSRSGASLVACRCYSGGYLRSGAVRGQRSRRVRSGRGQRAGDGPEGCRARSGGGSNERVRRGLLWPARARGGARGTRRVERHDAVRLELEQGLARMRSRVWTSGRQEHGTTSRRGPTIAAAADVFAIVRCERAHECRGFLFFRRGDDDARLVL